MENPTQHRAVLKLQDYNIHLGDFREPLIQWLRQKAYTRVFVLVDENTQRDCLPLVDGVLRTVKDYQSILIPSGEIHKNIETCQNIWKELMQREADRKSLLINLGGGVIGDMGGFCASTFKRGMDFIQVPTTLLAQVDASIGGKLGIDFMHIKNSVGVFNNPKTVIIDPQFLKTLSKRELRSGFAEIIKHSLIADPSQWEQHKRIKNLETLQWEKVLLPSLMIKKQVVEADPFEKGWRKSLNFGHTIGHAIETVFLGTNTPLLHGEAIAIGMICEAYLSNRQSGLSQGDLEEITQFIILIYGKNQIREADFPEIIQLMKKDKKNENQQINFTMLKQAGKALINQNASEKLIIESLKYYQRL